MRIYTVTSIEDEFEAEICQKTRKNEMPKQCDSCARKINKFDYYMESDASDYYCVQCCLERRY